MNLSVLPLSRLMRWLRVYALVIVGASAVTVYLTHDVLLAILLIGLIAALIAFECLLRGAGPLDEST